MLDPAAFDRSRAVARLGEAPFDLVVVGGGITGAGVALDAAARGLRTALVEKDDFASGTSSKSSKMVHGGLRYLQNGDVRLVYEALAERQRLRRNAPHLVRTLPFLLPMFSKDGLIPKELARAMGSIMWMYDLTGGARIGKLHQRVNREEALAHMPTLRADRLASGYLYYDARADDARLTLTLLRTAVLDHGATAVNRCPVVGIEKDADGRARAVVVAPDGPDGDHLTVETGAVVNATGVWADELDALDDPAHRPSIRPARGVHLTVPSEKVRCDIAVVLPVPKDKRSMFVVPWGDLTYIGTTDTDDDSPLDDPQCTDADVDYLLGALNTWITEPVTRDDVVGTWAGLRPLVKADDSRTADLSRRHRVQTSASGVVTVIGGKLTTYRLMAADAVDAVQKGGRERGDVVPHVARRSPTARLRLRGAAGFEAASAATVLGLSAAQVGHLADRYGGEAPTLFAMVEAEPALAGVLVEGLPYLRVEALYAVRYEMATTLADVLDRRTRSRLLGRDASGAAAAAVADLIGDEIGWSAARRADEVAAYRASLDAEREHAHLPESILQASHP
jgi:glycerol-3-phosphate dehydrogenase